MRRNCGGKTALRAREAAKAASGPLDWPEPAWREPKMQNPGDHHCMCVPVETRRKRIKVVVKTFKSVPQ
eukprot:9832549-Alexandrium_andersonii.AAC.1